MTDVADKMKKLLSENSHEELMQEENRLVVLNLKLTKILWAGIEFAAEEDGGTPSEVIAGFVYQQILMTHLMAKLLGDI